MSEVNEVNGLVRDLVKDTISRNAAIDVVRKCLVKEVTPAYRLIDKAEVMTELMMLPSAEPEIIRCKDCKHWNLQVGNIKGDGLGSCDFHNVNLVTGEGFCYWADMRGEEDECEKSVYGGQGLQG